MKRLLMIALLGKASFFSSITSYAQSCGFDYPTTWSIVNPSSSEINLACRVYHGGWSYQQVREVRLKLKANAKETYSFADHNDGLGMIHRNWSCAVSKQAHPLMHENSIGFNFQGCPDSELNIPQFQSGLFSALEKSESNPSQVAYCPQARDVERQYQCDKPSCSWDKYGIGNWSGKSGIMDPDALDSLQFMGVDVSKDGKNALGCLYFSIKYDQSLVLLSYLKPQSGSYPNFRYKPYNIDDFKKSSGSLLQCFGDDPSDCPLVLKEKQG
ncbi:MAG: hypothetical protein AB8G05_08900 [Oligoflexales bacterium]